MNFHRRAHADRGSIITMLRFLTENGRNRSNSRQLSEILFFCEAKASAHVRTVQMEADLLLKIFRFLTDEDDCRSQYTF